MYGPQAILLILVPLSYAFWIIVGTIFSSNQNDFANSVARKLLKKDFLTKIDFEKTKDYYRDILYNHSIIELSYVDDLEIDLKKEVVATLLSLEMKNKIKITDKKIEIINKDDTDLKLTEKDIFNCIEDGKVVIKKPSEFIELLEKHAIQEGVENGLLKKVDDVTKSSKTFQKFILFTIITIVVPFVLKELFYGFTYYLGDNKISLTGAYICSVAFSLLMSAYMLFLIYVLDIFFNYRKRVQNMYERTNQGNELNEKIEGLKHYIRDYSLLSEKEKEALTLWDEYLIYSVEFKQNKDIMKKISKLIQIGTALKFLHFTKKEIILAFVIYLLSMSIIIICPQAMLAICAFAFVIYVSEH